MLAPARAADSDPLSLVLSAVPAAPCVGAARLECASRRAQAAASALELFANAPPSPRARARAADLTAPELEPWFSDRDASLDALYRTLAVLDDSLILRRNDECDAGKRREALLSSPGGLFSDPKTGKASAWVVRLLGPVASGHSAADALDAGSRLSPSAQDYARLRARERALTLVLIGNPDNTAARCERSQVYERLAAAHRARGRERLTARVADASAAESVALLVTRGSKGWFGHGAAVVLAGPEGARLVTDASAALDAGTGRPREGLSAIFLRHGRPSSPQAVMISRWDSAAGLAEGPAPEGVAGVSLGENPKPDDYVETIAQGSATGLWGRTLGLVSRVDGDRFDADAALEAAQRGGAVLNENGRLIGILTRSGQGVSGIGAEALSRWLKGGSVEPALASAANSGTSLLAGRLIEAGMTVEDPSGGGLTLYDPQMGPIHFQCAANCGDAPAPTPAPAPQTPTRPQPQPYASAPPAWASALGQIGNMLGQYWGRQLGQFLFGGPNSYAAPAVVAPAPSPAPPKPARPQDELKVTGLRLTAVPSFAGPGDKVRIVAQLLFNDPDYPEKMNQDVSLTAPAGAYFIDEMSDSGADAEEEGDPQAHLQTDGSGRATAELRIKPLGAQSGGPSQSARGLLVMASADTPDGMFQANVSICPVGVECRAARVVSGLSAAVVPLRRVERGQDFALSATVAMEAGADPSGIAVEFHARDPKAVLWASGAATAVGVTDAEGVARVSGHLAQNIPESETEEDVIADVEKPDDGEYVLAGVSPAAAILLLEDDDCALKPGEDPLVRFVDGTMLAEGYLRKHESAGGHTIERHVNIDGDKNIEYLRSRLNDDLELKNVSYFNDLSTAESAIRRATKKHRMDIALWFNGPNSRKINKQLVEDVMNVASPLGYGISRADQTYMVAKNGAAVILKRSGRCEILILSAWPQ